MEKAWLRWAFALLLVTAVSACGDDSSGDADGGAGSGGDGDGDGDGDTGPVSMMIEAAEGGMVEANGVELEIPGGALDEDTEIVVEVILSTDGLPEADSIVSLVYELGPDGQTFSEPVTLTIELNDDVPEGMEAKMAWLDEATDTWEALADSRVEGQTVIASTDHFTKFAVVVTPGGQTTGMCDDFEGWEPCGGDIVGTWSFALACADVSEEDILADLMCEGASVTIEADISGTITFDADGGYESEITNEFAFSLSLPTSCLMGATCEQFAQGGEYSEEGEVCTLSMGDPPETTTEMGTYELSGNAMIMMPSDAAEADPPSDYCVEGDVITVRDVSIDEETGEEQVSYIQAMRQ